MNDATLAQKILTRRESASPCLMMGDFLQEVGPEGYETALAKGWVEPDYESGGLLITSHEHLVLEMRNAAKGAKVSEDKHVVKSNPYRLNYSYSSEAPTIDGSTIQHNRPRVLVNEEAPPVVGDQVVVGDDGKQFTGVVQSVAPDGTYKLSFEGNNRPRVDRSYRKEELNRDVASTNVKPKTSGPVDATAIVKTGGSAKPSVSPVDTSSNPIK